MSEFAKEILPVNLEDEMQQSYLDYAMSVIVGRALPDVRDGLKPVHRRVLFAMQQLVDGVNKLGLSYIPSVGNFLTIDMGREAAPIDQALLRLGVVTRPIANYELPNHLRVSIGLPEENARFLSALEQVL